MVKSVKKYSFHYIRPNLEYCIQAQSPYNQKDIDTLEKKVQRRATKMVKEIQHLSYEDKVKKLNSYSLEEEKGRSE